jgi:hypothetical protein
MVTNAITEPKAAAEFRLPILFSQVRTEGLHAMIGTQRASRSAYRMAWNSVHL